LVAAVAGLLALAAWPTQPMPESIDLTPLLATRHWLKPSFPEIDDPFSVEYRAAQRHARPHLPVGLSTL
jgi:hypothetical protein